jgi:NAD(P)H-dependent FMN reductase
LRNAFYGGTLCPMLELHVIVASTRPGRVGLPVANWFLEAAKKHGKFEVVLEDLLERNLPHIDEPNHPRLRKYEKEHTKAWSARVDKADAFVAVTPEYNYGSPPALINAFDYLYHEWTYKPMAFVSYGGVSGGTRSVQMTKLVATTLKMMPLADAVSIPFVTQHLKDGAFVPTEAIEKSANAMLDELLRWAQALKTMR